MKKILICLMAMTLLLVACSGQFSNKMTGQARRGTVREVYCTDSDGGANYYKYGRAWDGYNVNYDYCGQGASGAAVKVLYEAICTPQGIDYVTYYCPNNSCQDGVCLQ